MRNTKVIVFLILAFGLIFFGCKSQEKKAEEELEQEVVEATEEEVGGEEEAVESAEARIIDDNGYNVFFAPESYQIDERTAAKLNLIINRVKMEGPISIKIVGHSAKLNGEKEEEKISLKRAIAVAEYLHRMGLIGNLKISRVEGVGAAKPLQPHSDITARSFNRRVEIEIEK